MKRLFYGILTFLIIGLAVFFIPVIFNGLPKGLTFIILSTIVVSIIGVIFVIAKPSNNLGSAQHIPPILKYVLSIIILLLEIPVQFWFGVISFGYAWNYHSKPFIFYLLSLFILLMQTYLAYRLFKSAEGDRDHNSLGQKIFAIINLAVGIMIFSFYLIWLSLGAL